MDAGTIEVNSKSTRPYVTDADSKSTHPHKKITTTGAPDLQILRTCRQIYVEAALLPFARNTFYFYESPEKLAKWFKKLAKPQKAAIEEVKVYCFEALRFPLQDFQGLKRFISQHSVICENNEAFCEKPQR
jgi:hypothetical protein